MSTSLLSSRASRFLAIALASGMAMTQARADDRSWPSQPIKIIVPFAAGGVTDVLARVLTDRLGKALKQPVIADNRPGAGATIGAAAAATARPDGYTLLLMTTSHLSAPVMYKNLPYDMMTDFVPVSRLVSSAFVMTINPQVPARNLSEFIALSKARPGEMNFGSSGNGGNQHLVGAMYLQASGTDLKHVPYKGSGPVITDLIGGQIQMSFMALTNAIGHIKSGKLRALGVTSQQRMHELPAVPTLAEAGLPGFKATFWIGLVAPKGTPAAVVQTLDTELQKLLRIPEVEKQLYDVGLDVDIANSAQFASYLKSEQEKWVTIARDAKITE